MNLTRNLTIIQNFTLNLAQDVMKMFMTRNLTLTLKLNPDITLTPELTPNLALIPELALNLTLTRDVLRDLF